MRSTSRLRRLWRPACGGDMVTITISGGARLHVRRVTVPVWRAIESVMDAHGYTVDPTQTGSYNCRKITGGSGYSLHAYGTATDYNWRDNPYRSDGVLVTDMPPAMVADIKAIRTPSGKRVVRWGGDYSSVKDPMHFEVVASPRELRDGVAAASPMSEEDDVVKRGDAGNHVTWWQWRINEYLHDGDREAPDGIATDGAFGPATERAVKQVQADWGWPQTGQIDVSTAARLTMHAYQRASA